MRVTEKNVPAGLVAIVCAVIGGAYVVRVLLRAIENGFSPGKLGAVHQAGTVQYTAFVIICCIGIVLMLVLAFLGSRWMGLIDKRRA